MVQIHKTQKKLREAKFFFSCLCERAGSTNLESEELDFYLSAFITAGRSVTLVLQKEQKELYDTWFPEWKNTQAAQDQELLSFMNDQRVKVIHKLGTETEIELKYVPVSKLKKEQRAHPAYGIHWWGPPDLPEPRVGTQECFFERDGTKEEVRQTCKQYIELLERLVKDFSSRFSMS
jgi:hypothetical protein